VMGMKTLSAHKPEIKKQAPPVSVPMAQTVQAEASSSPIRVHGEGTVSAMTVISLAPQVGGKVIYVSPALVNGGEFKKGETLLRIDPVDYELEVTLAEAAIKDSLSNLSIEKEEAAAAAEEWTTLYGGKEGESATPPALVAREPQLEAAQAKVQADRADLKKARLKLQRTVIDAPFDGRICEENVDVGQYVTAGQSLASLFSTEAAEITVPLEEENLFWFHTPGFTPGDGQGAPAKVYARIAGRDMVWQGRVVRAEGELDESTRMINVVVRVKEPYKQKPPLVPGYFVRVEIEGRTAEGAVIIPRAALRENDVVWVVEDDGLLHFRKVEVARLQQEDAVVISGLKGGERVVLTNFKVVTDGMKVRVVEQEGSSQS